VTIIELTNIPIYDLGDLLLRPINASDDHDMYEYGSDEEVTKMLSWNAYKEPLEAKEAIEKLFLTRPAKGLPMAHAIVDKASNKMIGTCDFPPINWEEKVATLGYCLNRNYWNKGYMTRVVKALIPFAFDYLQLNSVKVQHYKENIGSKRVIIKSGFTYIGDEYNKSTNMTMPTYLLKRKSDH